VARLDAILARVLARAFSSICAEMGSATIRTAVSAVFVEGRDFSCALLDPRAELVAAANFDPSHLSAMPLTAEYAVMELGYEQLADGDVIVVNDPYRGGGHLTDIAVLRPVYVNGELLAFAMNRGHHIDIGGIAVAGFPGTARSIYQEGLRIPPVKWFEGGVERRQVMDMVLLNVRFPSAQLGDFQAQLASCVAAEQRLRALVARYGVETVREAMHETKNHSEQLMRHAIASIPDGAYRFVDVVDDDGVGAGPFRIAVEVRITGDHATVDFAGTSAQADGPINSSYGNTIGSCFNAFLHAFGAQIAFNGGCFRPIEFRVPRGSFLNPVPPAPVFGGVTEVSIRIIDAISGALAQAVPGSVAAGSYGTCLNVAGGGFDGDRGRDFGFYFFQEGGWGATAWRDGWTSVPNPTSNFNDYPVEVIEEELPLRCLEVALHEGSGGAGLFRGGLGTRRVYELLADRCELNALGERFTTTPHGLAGGSDGAANALLVGRRGDQQLRSFQVVFGTVSASKFASLPLTRGDRFAMITGGGGGYGDPFCRPVDRVVDDVREQLVSVADAHALYGVVVRCDGVSVIVDEAATAAARAATRPPPAPTPPLVSVPPPADDGREAGDAALVHQLASLVAAGIGDDPCRTRCAKRGDPVRCPFHHPFALDFWDGVALERWAGRHCLIVREQRVRRGQAPGATPA
jgi:N-methylhydantoinase B/oxoprolinase/acetone carboxylase alpha subunit